MKSLKFLPLLLIAACDTSTNDVGQTLRTGEPVCPPGCVCTCEPLGTSSSGVVGSDSTASESSDTDLQSTTDTGSDSSGVAESSSGDSTSGDPPPTTWPSTEGLHEVNGRRYRVVYPETWDLTVRPLFAFHPCSNPASSQYGANNEQYDSYHFDQNGNFMVIVPETEQYYCWDTDPNSSDMAFVQELIQEVESWPFLDTSQRFITGWSAGSFMSQSVACHMGADTMVVGSGALYYLESNGDAATTLPSMCDYPAPNIFMHHGINDSTVDISYAEQSRDFWADQNGCTGTLPISDYPIDWCHPAPGYDMAEPCECWEYICPDNQMIWCQDGTDHSQSQQGWVQRNAGEVFFADLLDD